jgi:gamma-glutamyltranspeptidase/glutathione hydrolase
MEANNWHAESRQGMVVAGAAPATQAGMDILARGGNAADAAAGTILALNVTDHGLCSIGGEVPVLIYDATSKQVKALSGQGRAPLSKEAIDWYMANGIPGAGDVKIAPVPSVVDLCTTLLQKYGTMRFADIVEPALKLLDAGKKVWHPKLAATLRKLVDEERASHGSREEALQAVSNRFYGRSPAQTDIADEFERFYREGGGFLRKGDLANHRTTIEEPVTFDYRGYTVCKCGTWTQGPMLLEALRLLEGFDLQAMSHLSPDYIHVVVEALKLAMADRDTYYGDPEFVKVPLEQLLSRDYAAMRRGLIDLEKASLEARPGDPIQMKPLLAGGGVFRPGEKGTTTCVVADRWGNVVAATPSANCENQDQTGGGTLGVTFSNRLVSLNTTPGHPNCIAPGKRPRITLTPTLVLKEGKPILAISVAGGDLQDQVTLNLLLSYIDFGLPPKEAVTVGRFATAHHQDSFNPNRDRPKTFKTAGSVTLAASIDASVRDELARRGHKVTINEGPIATPTMIEIHRATGEFRGAGDPKAGRHAGGL